MNFHITDEDELAELAADYEVTYGKALARARADGAAHCDDAALMAGLLAGACTILIGPGANPRLVWKGAQAKGMTTRQLAELIHEDPVKAADLMFVTPGHPYQGGN